MRPAVLVLCTLLSLSLISAAASAAKLRDTRGAGRDKGDATTTKKRGGTKGTSVEDKTAPADTTAPQLSLPASLTAEASNSGGAVVLFDVSAADETDGELLVDCIPSSGWGYPLGTTTVVCEATDNAGNSGSGYFDVSVIDSTIPAIARIRGRYIRTLMVKIPQDKNLKQTKQQLFKIKNAFQAIVEFRAIRMSIDVDNL